MTMTATAETQVTIHSHWFESADVRVARLRERLGNDATAITMSLLAELDVYDMALDVLFPWVRDRVRHELRQLEVAELSQRRQEHVRAKRARAHGRAAVRKQAIETPRELAFLDFKVTMAGVPAGWKLYRHLTPKEHEARRLIYRKIAKPALESARGHEWAIDVCGKHQVTCLNDIPADVLVQELPEGGVRP
jgi:hypothetical protein